MNMEASFGHHLKQRRKQQDLSQEELAERVGVAADTIRRSKPAHGDHRARLPSGSLMLSR